MIKILLSTRLGERRWSQADLSRATGIRAATINEIYNECTDRISLVHLDRICAALDCDVSDVLVYTPSDDTYVRSRSGTKLHTQD
jgi:putative transcriptional regulator